MLKTKSVPIASIYVPLQRRDTLDAEKVQRLCRGNLARDMWKRAGHGRDHAAVAACQSAWASALNVRSVRREIR